jgi:hypothetical protein
VRMGMAFWVTAWMLSMACVSPSGPIDQTLR